MSTGRYSFDIVVHARPEGTVAGPSFSLRGLELPTLIFSPAASAGFARTFEEVGAELERFERLYFEPDGSFVWVSPTDAEPWQLDGMLYDRNDRVLHMELKGSCPAEAFDRITAALGRPIGEMVFQLSREALFLDDTAFRSYATAEP